MNVISMLVLLTLTPEVPLRRKWLQLHEIENNWPVTDYRRYSFILNRKQYIRIKIKDVTGRYRRYSYN